MGDRIPISSCSRDWLAVHQTCFLILQGIHLDCISHLLFWKDVATWLDSGPWQVYAYIYVYICVCVYICIYMYIYNTHTYMYTHTQSNCIIIQYKSNCINTYIKQLYLYMLIYKYIYLCKYVLSSLGDAFQSSLSHMSFHLLFLSMAILEI